MASVEIYTQRFCPYCSRAVSLLRAKGVSLREIDAPNGSAARAEAVARSGRHTVPQVFVGERHLGGCDDLVALDRRGELDAILAASPVA